jgi:hypothetical protein
VLLFLGFTVADPRSASDDGKLDPGELTTITASRASPRSPHSRGY